MDKQQKTVITVTAILLVLSIIATVAVFLIQKGKNSFTPPPFDGSAISGMPTVDNNALQYRKVDVAQGFSFYLAMCPRYEDGEAKVYLTSCEDNIAYVRIILFDSESNVIGESGLIKPGEYIEGVALSIQPTEKTTIKAKILSYDPQTYYSMGASDGELSLIVDNDLSLRLNTKER